VALFRRRNKTSKRWIVGTIYPFRDHEGAFHTAHEALVYMGVDPREVLGSGALSRAGIK
jgi:hypothetical protein